MCQSFYNIITSIGNFFQSILLLIVRLYWGYGFLTAGYGKLLNIDGTTQFFQQLGIPFPHLNAYLAGGVEFIGGLFLIIGLFSRLVSIPLMFTMLVAYVTAFKDIFFNAFHQPADFIAQSPFPYLLASFIIFCFGPGKISIDYLMCCCMRKKGKEETSAKDSDSP